MDVRRTEDGDLSAVEVARWGGKEGSPTPSATLWRTELHEGAGNWGNGLYFRYEEPGKTSHFTVDLPHGPTDWPWPQILVDYDSGLYGLQRRRIRWALSEAVLIPHLFLPLLGQKQSQWYDPIWILCARRGDDPEVLAAVERLEEALYRRQEDPEAQADVEAGIAEVLFLSNFRLLSAPGMEFEPQGISREIVRMRVFLLPKNHRDYEDRKVSLEINVGKENSIPWLTLSTYSPLYAWQTVLWSSSPERDRGGYDDDGYGEGRRRVPFRFVCEDEIPSWEESLVEPGEISIPSEIELLKILGEPSPFAQPDEWVRAWVADRD